MTSNKIKEVADTQESKANSITTVDKEDEIVTKKVDEVESNKSVETLANTEKEERHDSTIVKEKIEPVQKLILKAGIEYINAVKFKGKIEGSNVQLVDVRTPKEFTNERIKGAVNINYYKKDLFKKEMAKLDKSKPVYVYCRSGVRSSRSAKILKNAGFKVYDLKGGILDWKRNNLETVK